MAPEGCSLGLGCVTLPELGITEDASGTGELLAGAGAGATGMGALATDDGNAALIGGGGASVQSSVWATESLTGAGHSSSELATPASEQFVSSWPKVVATTELGNTTGSGEEAVFAESVL